MRLVPNAEVLPQLQRRHGRALFFHAEIPAGVYPGVREPVPTVGAANVLVADAAMSESLAYDILRALFDHGGELLAVHPAAKELSLATASAAAAAPFHPGATIGRASCRE